MVEINVPFPGFYESYLNMEIDNVDQQCADEFTPPEEEMNNADVFPYDIYNVITDNTNYAEAHIKIAEAWVDALSNYITGEYGLYFEMTFKTMTSPREYNFSTDRVFANITDTDLEELFERVDKASLTKVCEEQLKPRSGFISFYDHNWVTWGPLHTWDANQTGLLLEALLDGDEMWEGCVIDGLSEDIANIVDSCRDYIAIEHKIKTLVMIDRGEIEPDARVFPLRETSTDDYVRQFIDMNHLKE